MAQISYRECTDQGGNVLRVAGCVHEDGKVLAFSGTGRYRRLFNNLEEMLQALEFSPYDEKEMRENYRELCSRIQRHI